MQPSALIRLLNQIGIEAHLGGSPTQIAQLPGIEESSLLNSRSVIRVDRTILGEVDSQLLAFVEGDRVSMRFRPAVETDEYASSILPSLSALVDEIVRYIPIACMPEEAYGSAQLTLDDAQVVFDQVTSSGLNTASFFLVSDGLSQEDAETVFDTLRTASIAARISFMAIRGDDLQFTYGIWVGQDGDDSWMTFISPLESDSFVLETVMAGAFRSQLLKGLASLSLAE